MKIKMPRNKTILLTTLGIIIGLLTATIYYSVAGGSNGTFTISQGVYPGAPLFTIWKEDSTYYAKNSFGVIKYYGTNASNVMQNAIDQIESNGRGELYITEAIYYDVALVVESSNIIISGSGKGTLLNTTLNQRVIWVKGMPAARPSGVVIRNLLIYGSGAGANQRGIEIQYADFCVVDTVWVENCGYDNFLIIDDAYGNRIVNCYSKDAGDDNFNINKADRNIISNCYSVDATNDNYHISMGAYHNIIDSCVSVTAGAYGINLYPQPACKFNTISNNLIKESGSDGIFLNNAERNTITGNNLDSNTGIGIKLYNGSHYNIIGSNEIYQSTRGIWLDDSSGSNHYNVLNDNFLDYNVNYGIVSTGSHKCTIAGNLVKNTQNYDGILLEEDSDKNTLTGNNVADNGQYGIFISNSTSDRNLVVGNTCMDNTSVNILDDGTNTAIHSCWNGTSWIT